MKKFISLILCITILFSFVACGQEKAEEITEYHMTSSELIDEYEEDTFATDNKYEDKIIYLTGKIRAIDDMEDRSIIEFGNDDKQDGTFVLVYCSFNNDDIEQIAGLQIGEIVTVRGRYGNSTFFNMNLWDCQIVTE